MIPQLSALLLTGALAAIASPTRPIKRADPKAVLAHVIVGNTYNYNADKWKADINLAYSKAIDVFTMNVGRDDWQPGQVKTAYDAAQQVQPNFKLSVSLDMNSLPCATVADGQYIINNFIAPFKSHSSRYLYNGKMFLSTFAGQWCTFGQSSAPAGWQWLINNAGTPIYFIPNFQFGDATLLKSTWNFIDGYKLWNAWPKGTAFDQWNDDAWWMQNAAGKGYLTLVAPWFFIHLPGGDPAINNRYLKGDDFMYRQRWQQLIDNRNSLPFVEVATWNDYGESHYIGPMTGLAPVGSSGYITSKNDHQAWADYTWYYATWWKSGAAPTIATDRVYMWARPHPKNAAICNNDGVGSVLNSGYASDNLYISLFLKSTAQAYCWSGGNNSGTKTLNAGVNEFTVPLGAGGVGCTVTRNGATLIDYRPSEFTYTTSPSACNMNAWTGMLRG